MHQVYEDHLFSRGYLVADPARCGRTIDACPAEALVALAHFGEIRITVHPELADLHMLEVAARNLGQHVPEPFMRGFPKTARELSPELLAFDQFVHYLRTYGLGDFSEPGHSLFEGYYERAAFTEDVHPRSFAIIMPEEAEHLLGCTIDGFLESTRPLNDRNHALLVQYLDDHDREISTCACKDTACRLIIDRRDPGLADLLALPDVIRLVEWLLELHYPEMTLNELNLRNQDRKLVSAVLDRVLERGDGDVASCLEKKRTWNGLLHHIHYRPGCDEALAFCRAVRDRGTHSVYSVFERRLQDGDVHGAVEMLRKTKGADAVLRNLVYLLSRCTSDAETEYVLDAIETRNKVVLVQLLIHFHLHPGGGQRFFRFVHLNRMRKHAETEQEMARRRSLLGDDLTMRVLLRLEDQLQRACHGALGKVYVSGDMCRVALPLQEAASMGGYGTLPRGSRLPIPEGRKVRAFVHWEKVDDIDLSCIGLADDGCQSEYSWRTMSHAQSSAIVYSGDETSGFHGGSEFFDVDLALFRQLHPRIHYLIFCANVYTAGKTFSTCVCRAGYMLRDEDDSGEVFEPRTVQSSFTVDCAGSAAYLFALDLHEHAFVWLNLAEESAERIAGRGDMRFLQDYLHMTDVMNLHDFACLLATEVVDSPGEADVVFSDDELVLSSGQEQVRSHDTARIIELLNV